MSAQHRRSASRITLVAVVLLLATTSAFPQVLIKVNDQVNFKLGVLLQTQADWLQDAATRGYTQNLFIRRARLLFGGQVAPNVTFFVETDTPNLGKVVNGTKNISPPTILQDAYVEYKFNDHAQVDAGLMLVSATRNGLQSAASLLPIDYGAYSFTTSGPTQNSAGRDTGAQLKGYFNNNHFEYRVAVLQGARDAKSRGAFRTIGRVMYNFWDPETGYFYTGTYLGKKKVLAIGGGYDVQHDYKSTAIDAFLDRPLGPGAITAQVDLAKFDGGKFLTAVPEQNDQLFELGYYINKLKISPVVQYVHRDRMGSTTGDEARTFVGLNWWRAGHNANLKAGFTRIEPRHAQKLNEFTVQLQFFYF